MRATIDDLKALRLASPVSAFSFWHFELVEIAERRGIPAPIYPELEALHRAGLTPDQAVAKIAKRYRCHALLRRLPQSLSLRW